MALAPMSAATVSGDHVTDIKVLDVETPYTGLFIRVGADWIVVPEVLISE
jgi:hypothetical protein